MTHPTPPSPPPPPPPRIVHVYETIDGRPSFANHERITDTTERARLLDYLNAGRLLLRTTACSEDVTDPGRGKVVPMSIRTDGSWIWNDALAYYLDTHGIGPRTEFLTHIRARGYLFTTPTKEQIDAAQNVLKERNESGGRR
ncbi:conserved hypothetical protein [Frankia sp. AiPs1]|uniref:hypothetical protein n=1 Tax=Frankia sp. AiPa1 TaxID=573492 RepID=UPI00202AF1DE|nr:hypothetical protein [Frankia sp. AiPa1]MCL9759096.1 hypothetical protein [Frankia sp. AiPa1]